MSMENSFDNLLDETIRRIRKIEPPQRDPQSNLIADPYYQFTDAYQGQYAGPTGLWSAIFGGLR
jgi:hypothetical protein